MTTSHPAAVAATCSTCASFERDALRLERRIPGLATLSSAHGASRAGDGLCLLHDRLLRSSARCASFKAAVAARDSRAKDGSIY